MARKNKRTDPGRVVKQVQQRQPRFNVRGQLLQNTMVSGNRSCAAVTTDANGLGGAIYFCDARDSSFDPVGVMSTLYNSYKYLPGTQYEYHPAVGLNTAGTVYLAYVTNPELMFYLESLITTPQLSILNDRVRAIGNVRTGPVWSHLTLPMYTVYRRPKFDVNAQMSAGTDNYDRSVQGAFVLSIIGAPVNTAICRNTLHKKLQLFELQATGGT